MPLINFNWEGYVYLILHYFPDLGQIFLFFQDVLLFCTQSAPVYLTECGFHTFRSLWPLIFKVIDIFHFSLFYMISSKTLPSSSQLCYNPCILDWHITLFYNQIRSVAQSCPTLCNPMNRSMPGLPVHHQLLEFTETHVHWVSDAIQPSHLLSSLSPPAPNPSQHQSLFQWVNSSHEVAKVLEFQL